MPLPLPLCSRPRAIGRPLTALFTITSSVPVLGLVSPFASHLMRHWVASILKDSVWVLPRPEKSVIWRHPTRGVLGFAGAELHAERESTATSSAAVRANRSAMP